MKPKTSKTLKIYQKWRRIGQSGERVWNGETEPYFEIEPQAARAKSSNSTRQWTIHDSANRTSPKQPNYWSGNRKWVLQPCNFVAIQMKIITFWTLHRSRWQWAMASSRPSIISGKKSRTRKWRRRMIRWIWAMNNLFVIYRNVFRYGLLSLKSAYALSNGDIGRLHVLT